MQISFVLLLALVSGLLNAQTIAPKPSQPEHPDEIHQMYLDDQNDLPGGPRGSGAATSEKEFNERGLIRRARVRELLAKGELKTGEDFHDASTLFQHGLTSEDYLFAHILAMQAILKGDERSKWMAAATLDRYLQFIHQPQVFGTQFPLDPDVPHPTDPHAPVYAGRTQSPYDDALMPDTVRVFFCVPVLAQQRQNLATFNAGKRPAENLMVAPGCSR